MTHDEMTAYLRLSKSLSGDDTEIADRLDLYRTLLRRCEWRLPCSAMRPDVEVLQRDIQEALR